MDLFKLDKYDKYFVTFVLVIITLFNVGQCFATDIENVDLTTVSNLGFDNSTNYFYSSDSYNTYYFEIEKGYKYTITNNKSTATVYIASSNNIPSVNVTYDFLAYLRPSESYSLISSGTNYYYISAQGVNNNNIVVTREAIEGQANAINGLVENVGVNQLWGVFEGGIDFVGVIVLVAFGLFLIFLLVKKISKGKADF